MTMTPTPHIPGADADPKLVKYVSMLRAECVYRGPCSNSIVCTCSAEALYDHREALAARIMPERPTMQPPRISDQPEWTQVQALFRVHGLGDPPWRLRDELVGWLVWARYGAALAASPAANVPPQVNEAVTQWRCAKCDCREFARCDTRLADTSWGPGDFVRCVNCKDVTFYPASPSPGTATAGASEQSRVERLETDAVGRGMAIAAGIAVSAYGAESVAEEILRAGGLDTLKAMREAGVDRYDIRLCLPVLKHLRDKSATRQALGGRS